METLIIGIVFNIWTWNNADFFVQRKNNERMYEFVINKNALQKKNK